MDDGDDMKQIFGGRSGATLTIAADGRWEMGDGRWGLGAKE